jgi:nucleotide-binding universal stress UspA family protein
VGIHARWANAAVTDAFTQIDPAEVVSECDPRLALAELVREEQIDLLVIGSLGRTGLTKLIMGGVASHLVAHAPCSVLVVKPKSV